MRHAFLIGLNTFLETIRNKVLYNIMLVAGVILLLSISFGDLSVFSRVQVMTDFGLATLSLTGVLLSVFIGVGMLGSEIASKTIYGVLTRPVKRTSFLVGKFVGLFMTVVLNFFLIAAVFFVAIHSIGGSPGYAVMSAVVLIAVEMAVLIAASILFSSFTTPALAAIFTIAFYAAGHLNDLVFTIPVQGAWGVLLRAFYYLLPNLEHFNIRTRAVYGVAGDTHSMFLSVCYGILYTVLLLTLATAVFSRKDL